MHFQYTPFIWPLVASAIVTFGLALYAFRHRDVRGAFPFALCMLLSSLWAASSILERSSIDLPTMLFWANVPFLSYTICPVLWLITVLLYIERDNWITPRNIALLLILPAVTQLIIWTGDPLSLIRQNVFLDTSGVFPTIGKTFGIWFWLILAYADLLNLISMLLMGWTLRRKSLLYRRQVMVLFIGLGLVILQNAAYICGIFPARYLDLTPVVIGISGLIIAWGIFSYQLFEIVPVARENIIENMPDGLIVLDSAGRIADINPAARNIFGQSPARLAGQDAMTFLNNSKVFTSSIHSFESIPAEISVNKDGCIYIYEISSSPLYNKRNKLTGQYVTFHDVTAQRETQAGLLEQQKALATSKERERLARDLHDNLGQVFGFINVQAQAVRHEMSDAGVNAGSVKLDRLIEVTQSAHNQMREYIKNSREPSASGNDFQSTLHNLAVQAQTQSGIKVQMDIPSDLPDRGITPAALQIILGITKEALNNIQKHAGVKSALVTINVNNTHVSTVISDNGKGFDIDRLEKQPLQGLGLNIMKERATEAGGQLWVESSPGKGTRVNLIIPLNAG